MQKVREQMPACFQQTRGQILTGSKWTQFPGSAKHYTMLHLVRSWPKFLLLFLLSHANLFDILLKLLVRAECSFIYFHRVAPDFQGEASNQCPTPHWLESFLPVQNGYELPRVCKWNNLPSRPHGINGSDLPGAKAAWSWARSHTCWNTASAGLPTCLLQQGQLDSRADFFFCCCCCCFISRELKAPERLFIESAFECMLQHR